jgi:hypothetical protein
VPKKVLSALGWGLAGLAVALGLTLGAFALAGQEIADPATATVPSVGASSSPEVTPEPSKSDRASRSPDGRDGDGSGSPSASATPSPSDDGSGGNGGDDNSGSGSGGDDDHDDD